MTPLLPWFYDPEQSAIYCASDSEPEIVCQILDKKLAETIVYAVNCLAKSYTDKAGAWDAIAKKNAEIGSSVTAEDFGRWLFMDCNLAVYDCPGLAEEILKYFEVRPLPGVDL